jgi:hypothetical protein
MVHLIDGLNRMMSTLVGDAALGRVVHVNLTGTLKSEFGAGMSNEEWLEGAYKKAWENELHPTPAGFRALTDPLTAVLNTL